VPKSHLNSLNDQLRLGSTIHSLIEIASSVFDSFPHRTVAQYENHFIFIFKTLSKTLFIFLWNGGENEPPFKEIYSHYAEKVIRNYSYQLDMPINVLDFRPTNWLN
jgi:hypothetical protein